MLRLMPLHAPFCGGPDVKRAGGFAAGNVVAASEIKSTEAAAQAAVLHGLHFIFICGLPSQCFVSVIFVLLTPVTVKEGDHDEPPAHFAHRGSAPIV